MIFKVGDFYRFSTGEVARVGAFKHTTARFYIVDRDTFEPTAMMFKGPVDQFVSMLNDGMMQKVPGKAPVTEQIEMDDFQGVLQ